MRRTAAGTGALAEREWTGALAAGWSGISRNRDERAARVKRPPSASVGETPNGERPGRRREAARVRCYDRGLWLAPEGSVGHSAAYLAGHGAARRPARRQVGWQADLPVRRGGTADWSATVSNDPGAAISVSPSSGTLTRNSPIATVTVTADQFVPCDSASYPTLTINPGGTQFFVCTGWVKPFVANHHGHRYRRQLSYAVPLARQE